MTSSARPAPFEELASLRLRRSAKLHHPRLLRMQPQPVLLQPLRQHPKHPPRVVFVLEHQHRSSSRGESHPSALTEPDLRLSPHPALTLQPPVALRVATGRTTSGRHHRACSSAPRPDDSVADAGSVSIVRRCPVVSAGRNHHGAAERRCAIDHRAGGGSVNRAPTPPPWSARSGSQSSSASRRAS